ncbi:DNA polymerase/3'-5' exonuclease PolX [soil metagenome]
MAGPTHPCPGGYRDRVISNRRIAAALQELAELVKLEEGSSQAFRVRAYERAAGAVRDHPLAVAGLDPADLQTIDGLGRATADKVRQFIDTGSIDQLDKLRLKYPPDFVELTRIPGVGPKTAVMLRHRLGVGNIEDLRAAIAAEQVRELPGMGARSEEKIAKSIERLGLHGKDRRTPIIQALPVAGEAAAYLAQLDGVVEVQVCGSLRRFSETIGDIDIVVAADDASSVMAAVVAMPAVAEVVVSGDTKTSVLTDRGLQVDVRVVEPGQFGAATIYFTGSKQHNIELRQRAMAAGLLLNEYGLEESETGTVVAAATEEDVYRALGLAFVPPEIREGVGEMALAADDRLPTLVTAADIRGDLHVHSTWSGDGRSSLVEMIATAAARGLEYVGITEHGEDLAINGLSRQQIAEERAVIEGLREQYPDLTILHGAELNIAADGHVDYDDEVLSRFDWCIASVHSLFDQTEAQQTARVIGAIENPWVDAIGHLTGRRIGKRPGIELDFTAVFAAAAETGTALEINSHLDRLDVPAAELRRAMQVPDLRFTISTDSHHVGEFGNIVWGVANARRGWVEPARVVNTLPKQEFLTWLRTRRQKR